MRISPPLKAAIVTLTAAAWLIRIDASFGRMLVLAAGAALLTYAWIMCSPSPAPAAPAAADEPAAGAGCSAPRHGTTCVAHASMARWPRDLRCPASVRATARARRSTRR